MNQSLDVLLGDPLFQLNAVLWLTRPLPSGDRISPILHGRGFTVYAIAPLLAPPPEVRLAADEAGVRMQERLRPDVVLTHEAAGKFAFLECKAHSFGTGSSTSEQARGLLVVAGPRCAEVLALASRQVSGSLLALVTPESHREQLGQTLSALVQELQAHGLPAGSSSVLGMAADDSNVSLVIGDSASEFFSLPSGCHAFLKREEDTDPRPLYFIPYDPDVAQSEGERAFCKRVLFERIQSSILVAIGHAHPPTVLALEAHGMLNDAMFGAYGQWENRESGQHMRRLCRQLVDAIARAVNSAAEGAVISEPGVGWKVLLHDQEQQDKVTDALERFSCETFDLSAEPSAELFGDPEGAAPESAN
jgi:hypothetical protein